MDDVFVIANPSSGKGEAEQASKLMKDLYEANNHTTVEVHFTKEESEIARFAEEASARNFEYVVIIGGDGSINRLINAYENLEYRPKVGIIPVGTVNNIANSLNINRNYNQAVRQFFYGNELKTDVGQVNNMLFISSVSAGTIPEQAWQVSPEEKERLGILAYVIDGLQKLSDQQNIEYDIEVDDKREKIDLDLLVIGISNSVAGISNFFSSADHDDGTLYMFGLKQSNIGEKIGELSRLAITEGDNDRDRLTFIIPFKKATIYSSKQEQHPSVDGEKGPKFPITIEVLPEFVTIIVPSKNQGSNLFNF